MGEPHDAGARAARRARIEALFADAVDRPVAEREALLAAAAAADDDPALVDEVRSLLAVAGDDAPIRAAVAAAVDALAVDAPAARLGARLDRYRLREVIGEGGMGTVYLAERDDDVYRRRVAIKILRSGLGSPEAVARFRDERQLLARLDHPSIVELLDGGTTDSGLPYLVMELVDGVPVTEHARGLSLRRKVELVRAIGGAIEHAHQRLIVHRDIKPGNLLVDRAGVPKLLDFGIAKLLDEGGGREARTRTGMPLLTAEYASPEQARGEAVTVATDVYSLGAVLYELLVGAPPLRAQASMLATLRTICEVEPVRPSVAAPPALRRELAGDLDNIVMKALQKAPAARYGSVAALADDLGRWLTGQPVAARATTFTYRAGKFVRRHRAALAIAGLTAAALATATVVSIVQARAAATQRRRAEAQTRVAEEQTHLAEAQTRSLLTEQALQELRAGRASRALPYLVEVLRRGEDTPAIRVLVAEALRPLEQQLAGPLTMKEGLAAALWTPDGAGVVVADWSGAVTLTDPALRARTRLEAIPGLIPSNGQFTRGGRWLVAVARASDFDPDRFGETRVLVWDAATMARRWSWPTGQLVTLIAGDERHLAASGTQGTIVWDLATGAEVLRLPAGPPRVSAMAFAGARGLLAGFDDGSLMSFELTTGARRRLQPPGDAVVTAMATARDGRWYTCAADGRLRAFAAGATVPTFVVVAGRGGCAVATSPSDRLLVTVAERWVRAWDAATGVERATITGGWRLLRAVAISADDRRVALAADDSTFQVWDVATVTRELLIESFAASGDTPHSLGGALTVDFSPDGTRLLTGSGTDARVWRISAAPLERELTMPYRLWSARWSPDEQRLVAVGFGAGIFAADTGARLRALDVDGVRTIDGAWSHDGGHLAITGDDGRALVFTADGVRVRALVGHRGTVNGAVWSPDDRRLLTAGDDGAAIVWDAATGAELARLPHPARVLSATWSPDATRVLTAGWDRTLRLWDVERRAVVLELAGGKTQFLYAELSPDGTRLASAGHDGELTVWDLATQVPRSLEGHTGAAVQVDWSPDGALLASAADDGTVRIWDPDRGRLLATRAHAGTNLQVWWSRDGARLLSTNHDSAVRVWSVPRDRRTVAELTELARTLSPWELVGTRLVRVR